MKPTRDGQLFDNHKKCGYHGSLTNRQNCDSKSDNNQHRNFNSYCPSLKMHASLTNHIQVEAASIIPNLFILNRVGSNHGIIASIFPLNGGKSSSRVSQSRTTGTCCQRLSISAPDEGDHVQWIGSGILAEINWNIPTTLFNSNKEIVSQSGCLLYTSPSPRDATLSRMPSSA